MKDRFKELYSFLKSNGELSQVFPRATGDWDKDSERFIKFQLELEQLAQATDVEIEEDDQ